MKKGKKTRSSIRKDAERRIYFWVISFDYLDGIEKDILDLNKIIKSENPENDFKDMKRVMRKAKNKTKKIFFTENDTKHFLDIDIIVATLMRKSEGYTEDEILDALEMNSFNILNTYMYLQDNEGYVDLCFDEADDYVLKNLPKTKFYNELVKEKSKERVEERELFLNIEES